MGAQPVSLLHIFLKRILIVLFTTILGVGLGLSQAKAEYLYNQYVDGAGNVAIAGTNGYSSGGVIYTNGVSASSVNLYHLYAQNRIWHQSAGYNILQGSRSRAWYWSTGGATDQISSSGYGDRGVTYSLFLATTYHSATTRYTSYPDYSASCANYYNSGNNC
ncbi:hypothetical protein [Caldilinea sp.]|uniref:hypothetical protein n=1 Tax=Caldilinea sp. TaxID=2293560 RepID=UPI0021DF1F1E|nr:hypothetical protein [Caldilinea sp.]GIV67676.1 MAG: hypothetical protein KatS3mg048_0538 [Caldilinea sp.]